MSRKRQLPGYLLHKASGQARVVINGKDIWLGKYGTPESHDRYDEEIAKVLEQTRLSETNISISEVLAAFWAYAKLRLSRFKGLPKHTFYLHLKETEFRFNHRREDLYKRLLKLLREQPI